MCLQTSKKPGNISITCNTFVTQPTNMQNLFHIDTFTGLVDRVHNLSATLPPQWGSMTVSQMMAHCSAAFQVPLSEKPMPRILLGRIFGPLIKSKLYNEDPWRKNLPTAPQFLIKGDRHFDTEMQALVDNINKFYAAGPMGISPYPHPFFGKITPEQWGMSMYKHIDHHLKQFGV